MLQGVAQPLVVSWADPERRAALKRKFAGEPEPERQVTATSPIFMPHLSSLLICCLRGCMRSSGPICSGVIYRC